MNSKNAIWWVIGLIAIVIAVSLVVSNNKDKDNVGTDNATAGDDTSLTPDDEEVRQAELAYARAQAAYSKSRVKEGVKFVTIVNYTRAGGFDPQIISINRGESVRFVNKSSEVMRVTSNTFENAPIYPGFNQAASVGLGGTYSLSFTQPGVWGYHNLNGDPTVVGIVYVK